MKSYNIKEKMKEYFFVNPTVQLRVRHIEKTLSLPLPSVIRYAEELKKEGILKQDKISNVVFYSADRASKSFILEKKLFNIKSLYTFGLVEYLISNYHNPAIFLFGSYAKGEDIEKSDIDLYIETSKTEKINLEKFEKKLNRAIQVFTYKNINQVENKELANNIINGISLNGFLEVL